MFPPRTVASAGLAGLSVFALALAVGRSAEPAKAPPGDAPKEPPGSLECQVPDETLRTPFADERPILFVAGNPLIPEWNNLPAFWNETTEKDRDPNTGAEVVRKAVKIKLPLGLNSAPPAPPENPMTVAKWALGKMLYFDPVLSSNHTVSCATCHDPKTGFTTNTRFGVGIFASVGGANSPTVINAAYNALQFWDGRALSLEHQAQGPVGNPVEMFDGKGEAWDHAVRRVRQKEPYAKLFPKVFGTEPTRDAVAKAIACYERTVLSGDSVYDRAVFVMKKRLLDDDASPPKLLPADFAAALRQAIAANDYRSLDALGLNPERAEKKVAALAGKLALGRDLFFGKARCNSCHTGDTFSDNQFHNLGVGVKDGEVPDGAHGRYGSLPTGHKNPELIGAFKTPGLRALTSTGPYMHDGSEDTLEKVVEFYDRGGNANEYLDVRMRDVFAETEYKTAAEKNPQVKLFGKARRPVIPFKLNLSADEKSALVAFLKSLEGAALDPLVTAPDKFPDGFGR